MSATRPIEGTPTSINIRPGVGMIGLFPYMNYKPWFALGELVDNSLASFLQNRDALVASHPGFRLHITIEVSRQDGGRIRVWDNAAGIATGDYQRAFVSADPPPDASGLSQFGIGMKSASCWFARRWSVQSTALGEPVERYIELDVPDIVENSVEELTSIAQPAIPDSHYTELNLWDLHKLPQGRTITKMADHLASMYRMFIARGDVEIEFNGELLTFDQPAILTARVYNEPASEPLEWWKPIEFSLPTGESVSGFVAIRETASTAKAGLALFRNNRLIVGSDEDSYRPAEIFGAPNRFRYQRVFGELQLSGFDVSHTKDGFIWADREDAFLARLRTELDAGALPLLRQAENYRSRVPTDSQRRAALRALESTARAVQGTGPELTAQVSSTPSDEGLSTERLPATDVQVRTFQINVRGNAWEISIELTSDPAVTNWLVIAEPTHAAQQPRCLEIRMALAHPFMLQFGGTTSDDIEPLLRVAAALGLAEITARESGIRQAGAVRRNMNDLLRGSLSEP